MGIRLLLSKIYRDLMSKEKYVDHLRKKGVVIGDSCEIYTDSDFGSEPFLITIGSHVRINCGVRFITHDGGAWILRDKRFNNYVSSSVSKYGRIIVENNVHIGTNAIIMPNVRIGENSIIACGAIVTRNVPKNSIVGGIPARVIEDVNTYLEKNRSKLLDMKEKPSTISWKDYILENTPDV